MHDDATPAAPEETGGPIDHVLTDRHAIQWAGRGDRAETVPMAVHIAFETDMRFPRFETAG